jgi:hypothetical protein
MYPQATMATQQETMSESDYSVVQVSEDESDDDIILVAVKRIVKATTTTVGAKNAMLLLKNEFKKALKKNDGGNTDDDESDEDETSPHLLSNEEGEGDDEETLGIKGEWKSKGHKKNEPDKWRELMVYSLQTNTDGGDRTKSKNLGGKNLSNKLDKTKLKQGTHGKQWNLSNI